MDRFVRIGMDRQPIHLQCVGAPPRVQDEDQPGAAFLRRRDRHAEDTGIAGRIGSAHHRRTDAMQGHRYRDLGEGGVQCTRAREVRGEAALLPNDERLELHKELDAIGVHRVRHRFEFFTGMVIGAGTIAVAGFFSGSRAARGEQRGQGKYKEGLLHGNIGLLNEQDAPTRNVRRAIAERDSMATSGPQVQDSLGGFHLEPEKSDKAVTISDEPSAETLAGKNNVNTCAPVGRLTKVAVGQAS